MPESDPRRTLGDAGERLARTHLEARGLSVLDANFRTRNGELDIVAANESCLVFCEVKTRLARDGPVGELGPFASIDVRKQRRLRLLAREWLVAHEGDRPWRSELRFDAIGIELDTDGRLVRLDHLEGAF